MRKRLVITVHGIRTFGQWQERLEVLLKEEGDVLVENYHYGYFSVIAFLLPFFRWFATRLFRERFLQIADAHPDCDVSIIAHSFGTHLVGWGLRGIPRTKCPKIDSIVLAGSVLRRGFAWSEFLRDGRVGRVVNDCGIHDKILILSQVGVLLTGMAGRLGFVGMTSDRLLNRFFVGGHSHYFTREGKPDDEFMKQYWVPFLAKGEPPVHVDMRIDKGPLQGAWITMLQLADPLKFMAYGGLLYMAYLHGYAMPRAEAKVQAQRAIVQTERANLAEEKRKLEAIGRQGEVDIGMLNANVAREFAIAALGTAAQRDSQGVYPEFPYVLSYWLPTLVRLDAALSQVEEQVFVWHSLA